MKEITTIILDIAFTVFAIYGVYVLTKWKYAAQKISKMCDEINEEMKLTEEGEQVDRYRD